MWPVRGDVEDDLSRTEDHVSIKDVQAEFETRWATIYRAYRPLLNTEAGAGLVSWVSAVKGLAWNCYLQGRTDELSQQRKQERRLTRSLLTTRVRGDAQ